MDFELKTPKGTRDYGAEEMAVREVVFQTIISVFKRHGGVEIDTPTFELRQVLLEKYGDDSKLIYDLQDQGGEALSLRYDLSVPFSRFLAMNRTIKQMKRYQIGKVYRRDQPAMTKGRYREFYQCDYDIAGPGEKMVPDAELLYVVNEVLEALDISCFVIKLNHRKLLKGILDACQVPSFLFKTICSSIDKLDKRSWDSVAEEMIQKDLDPESVEKIRRYVFLRGNDLLQTLRLDKCLSSIPEVVEAVEELDLLFQYLDVYEISDRVELDLGLARGLDYYTGIIFEAVLIGESDTGSIVGGGRYDEMVGGFGSDHVPCVGFSVGIERIFCILWARSSHTVKANPTNVLVASIGKDMMEHRMRLAAVLWKNGIRAEFMYKTNPKFLDQVEYSERCRILLMVIMGQDELASDQVRIKVVRDRSDKGVLVRRDQIVEEILTRLNQMHSSSCRE